MKKFVFSMLFMKMVFLRGVDENSTQYIMIQIMYVMKITTLQCKFLYKQGVKKRHAYNKTTYPGGMQTYV
jgi:hypothetical protein